MGISYGKRGGAQPGAGRPKGSTRKFKFSIKENFTRTEIKEFVKLAKEKAKAGDREMLKFLLEQVYGKPVQATALTNREGEDIVIKQVNYNVDANQDSLPILTKTLPAPTPKSPSKQ